MSSKRRDDCIVVGGGLIGLLSAYLLARQGMQVTLLERGEIGRESSWAGGGILSPLYPWRYPDPVNELVAWSQAHYGDLMAQLHRESGIDPEWQRCGMLMLDQDERQQAMGWAEQRGVSLEQVGRERVAELEPALSFDGESALWMPDVGQVRNPRLLAAAKGAAMAAGVTLVEHAEVTELVSKDGVIREVMTPKGGCQADRVVVTAGAWSSALLQKLGISLEIEAVRGQMILFKGEPGLLKRITLDQGRYLIPRVDGHILMGSTLEYVGFDKSVTEEAREELHQTAIKMVPALADLPVVGHWAGLRPGTKEGIPLIGAVPGVEGLYINAGHFRNGVAIGYASSQLLADLLLNQTPVLDEHPFRIS